MHFADTFIAKPTEQQLMKELYTTVATKWQSIGTFLQITSEELNIIQDRHRGDPQKCLMAMLSVWLHQTNPAPGWPEIVAAVNFIGRSDVAQKIREKYCKWLILGDTTHWERGYSVEHVVSKHEYNVSLIIL